LVSLINGHNNNLLFSSNVDSEDENKKNENNSQDKDFNALFDKGNNINKNDYKKEESEENEEGGEESVSVESGSELDDLLI